MAYVIYANEQQEGPLEDEEILSRLEAGVLSTSDLIWDEGSQSWLEIGAVLVFHAPPATSEPPPGQAEVPATPEPAAITVPEKAPSAEVLSVEAIPKTTLAAPPPAEAPIPTLEEPWLAFTHEKQKRSVLKKIHPLAIELCALDEEILYMAVQRKPFLLFYSPECLVLTNKRLFIFFKRLLKIDYDEFRWEEILNLHFKEALISSHITFKAGTGQAHGIYYLPKIQGRKAMHLASQLHAEARERFKKAHIPAQAPRKPKPQPRPRPSEDPETQLAKLKKLLDEQLISQEDYEQKKHEILSRL